MIGIPTQHRTAICALTLFLLTIPIGAHAQEDTEEQNQQPPEPELTINASTTEAFPDKTITFDLNGSNIPEEYEIREVLWGFGDGTLTTGDKVSHAYKRANSYTVTVTVTTNEGVFEKQQEITIYRHVTILITDSTTTEDIIALKKEQAAQEGVLLLVLRARGGGPEVVTEEELANLLIDARDAVSEANLIISWTSGSVGSSVLSKFAQHIKQADEVSFSELEISDKAIIMLSETPFTVLAPSAQSAFDQLRPSYVLLTRPEAIDLLLQPLSEGQAQQQVLSSPIPHRLLGTFSARTVQDINITNFMSFGINYLVNRGVPINSITLILMLPVIATILSFSRQVIGIKAFGIVTPAMTTLSFLVTGLEYGLIIFSVILLSGTVTRMLMKKFHLLYLPRMALVLTNVSIAVLVLFGIGVATNNNAVVSFSIFPILILTLLAEEFIALQFSAGAKRAFTVTAWTLALAVAGYFIVSWELFRTVIVSYPEVILAAIPINILLGRWGGLRLTEYVRFRKLLRYTQ